MVHTAGVNERRQFVFVLGMGTLLVPFKVFAQDQSTKIARIGVLYPRPSASAARQMELLRAGLRERGYVEGKNLVLEFRSAEGKYDRLPDLAAELVRLDVDIIVTGGTPGTRAAKQATANIPIVMEIAGDAVATGLIASLARPGGNVTGATYFDPELHAKRFEILKEAIPNMTRSAMLLNPANPQSMGTTLQTLQNAAKSLKVEIRQFTVRAASEFEAVFASMVDVRPDAIQIVDDAMFLANLRVIAEIAVKKKLPSVGAKEFAEAGGMIGYGVDFDEAWGRAAYFIDKILKGAKPADIPVEQATRFELVVNRRTAKALGIALPQSILLRADRVIE